MPYTVKDETASLFVDPQKGFTPLCSDELPVSEGDQIVDALLEQLKYASIKTCSKDAHNENAIWIATKHFPQFTSIKNKENVDIRWNAHCIVGTKGAELLDGLPKVTEYDYFIWKGIELDMHPYSCVYHDLKKNMSTGLIEYLKDESIQTETVIVGGLATDHCIKETCIDLIPHFNVILNLEGCKGVAEETTKKALEEMKDAGIIIIEKVDELKEMIEI
jgi:nicotinamidase/pyrazinamidase